MFKAWFFFLCVEAWFFFLCVKAWLFFLCVDGVVLLSMRRWQDSNVLVPADQQAVDVLEER